MSDTPRMTDDGYLTCLRVMAKGRNDFPDFEGVAEEAIIRFNETASLKKELATVKKSWAYEEAALARDRIEEVNLLHRGAHESWKSRTKEHHKLNGEHRALKAENETIKRAAMRLARFCNGGVFDIIYADASAEKSISFQEAIQAVEDVTGMNPRALASASGEVRPEFDERVTEPEVVAENLHACRSEKGSDDEERTG